MAALLAGQGVTELARQYNLDRSTVKNWQRQLRAVNPVNQEKQAEIGDLLTHYLESLLVTLQVQTEHFREREWLAKQDASELAVLHGVCADKCVRLLEAAENAAGDE